MPVIPNTEIKWLTLTSFVCPSSHFRGTWLSLHFSLNHIPQWQGCISLTLKKELIELILLNISDCNRNDCLPFSLLIQQAQYIKLHWMSFLPNWGNSENNSVLKAQRHVHLNERGMDFIIGKQWVIWIVCSKLSKQSTVVIETFQE